MNHDSKINHWRYRIIRKVASGGQSDLYLADDLLTGQQVVLKTARSGMEADIKQEFIRLFRLSHHGLLRVYDFHQARGQAIMAMEYFAGETIRQALERGAINPESSWNIWCQLVDVVAYLHQNGYVHGDIKPENILVNSGGEVRLIDLGMSILRPGRSDPNFTGTPAYAPPEIVGGSRTVGPESDVYSLGLLLFEMLVGELPGVLRRMEQNQGWAEKLKDVLPPDRAETVLKALKYWPQERFFSAVLIREALGTAEHDISMSGRGRAVNKKRAEVYGTVFAAWQSNASRPLLLSGPPGCGKTSFLKELCFACQVAGRPGVYLDMETVSQEILKLIPSDTIVLADNLGQNGIDKFGLNKFEKLVAVSEATDAAGAMGAWTVRLDGIGRREYQDLVDALLSGVKPREAALLALLLEKRYGGNASLAAAGLGCLKAKGMAAISKGFRVLDWPAIHRDLLLEGRVKEMIEAQWGRLTAEKRQWLKECLAGELSRGKGIDVGEMEYWTDARCRIKGDVLKEFIFSKLEDHDVLDILLETKKAGHDLQPSPAVWRAFGRLEQWEQWLIWGVELLKQAEEEKDLERAVFIGDILLKSGRLDEKQQQQISFRMVQLYHRVGRWDEALGVLSLRADADSRSWGYHRAKARLLADKGEYDQARSEISAGESFIVDLDEKYQAQALKGLLDGLEGRLERGNQQLKDSLEDALKNKASDHALFDIYNSLIRNADRAGDYRTVVELADKIIAMESPELDARERAMIVSIVGHAYLQLRNFENAGKFTNIAIKILNDGFPDYFLSYIWSNYGLINMAMEEWGQAYQAFKNAELNLSGEFTRSLAASIAANLAYLDNRMGRHLAARSGYLTAAVTYQSEKNLQGMLFCLANAALKDHLLGRSKFAEKSLLNLREQALSYSLYYAASIICKDLGQVMVENKQYSEGLAWISEALELAETHDLRPGWDILFYGTLASLYAGDPEGPKKYWQRIQSHNTDVQQRSQIRFLEGMQAVIKRSDDKGVEMMVSAGSELKEQGDALEAAKAWLLAGEAALEKGIDDSLNDLMPVLLRAESEFKEMGATDFHRRARSAIIGAVRCLYSGEGATPGTKLLGGLYELAALLEPGRRQSELAQSCLELAVKLMGAERGGLFLMDEEQNLFLAAKVDMDATTQKDALEFSSNAVLAASRKGEMIVSNDAQLDESFRSRLSVKRNAIRSLLCVPLRSREGTVGAIYMDSRLKEGLFSGRQRDFMTALAGILGAVLESAMLFEELKQNSQTTSRALNRLIGNSAAVKAMVKRIKATAPSDVTVLLDGESGTGKELAARIIHELSGRRDAKFLALDCGSLPETLLESELFGYIKGSFTGASKDKAGLFESANGGTVFLDEIASASPGVQARLLRVIESGEVRRLGSDSIINVDVRLICATNRDLEIEINEGRFRDDLYYRLKVIKIDIPPLRERGDDVLVLAEHFKNAFQKKFKKGRLAFTQAAMNDIIRHSWPGNIRELENTIPKAVLLSQTKTITDKDLELNGCDVQETQTFKQEYDLNRKAKVMRVLETTEYNFIKAAKIIGVTPRHLYRMANKYGINRDNKVK
jgi:transcriptional regulator with GAF, ATPase, and Fis domain/serine/threonine protein kinase/tetratricopeptide (TPR) repeat protein